MTLKVGDRLLLPCEVKPGPFSDERMVRVQTDDFEWLGFVPISALESPVDQGKTCISARVTDIQGNCFQAILPGHAITSTFFRGDISRVKPLGSFQTRHTALH